MAKDNIDTRHQVYTLLVICESENKPFHSSVCCQIVENLPGHLEGEGGGGGGEKCSTYVLTKQNIRFSHTNKKISPESLKKKCFKCLCRLAKN